MSIKSQFEFEKLKVIGRIVAEALQAMSKQVRPGVTTAELDAAGEAVLKRQGARSSAVQVYNFPRCVCISVNDEAIHGIPGNRVIQPGDLVKLDLVAEKDGFHADAALSLHVPPSGSPGRELVRSAESAFHQGLRFAHAGNRVSDIGRAVEREVRRSGFSVIRELCGHGVGRTIHEPPIVPNYADPHARQRLTEGLVLTIEPIITAGSGKADLQPDGWTIRTADGSLSAHYEHTIVITRGEPVLLTVAA
jgi:methionyl aminopeptidase